mgnify:CR=1 FL=1
MMKQELTVLISWAIASALFSMSIWGGWAEALYQKNRNAYWPWYWLRFFHVELNEKNCIMFIKGASVVGLILVSIGSFVAILFML